MRELVIRRPLNPALKLEAIILREPSLSWRTLQNNFGGGWLVSLAFWQGSQRALGVLKREYFADPDVDDLRIVRESREGILTFFTERSGENPLDVGVLVQRAFGRAALTTIEKSAAGSTWRILTSRPERLGPFLRSLARLEDAFAATHGPIPRYALTSYSEARELSGPVGSLSPLEDTVLRAAVQMGFFDVPKVCGTADVAKHLRMPTTTAHVHLKKAEAKVLRAHYARERG